MSDQLRPWSEHLPPSVPAEQVDLVAGRSLVDAWTARWRATPQQPTLIDRTFAKDITTMNTMVNLTSVFESLASMRISQIKAKVQQSENALSASRLRFSSSP